MRRRKIGIKLIKQRKMMEENSETVLCAVKGVKQSQSLFNHIRREMKLEN